MRYDLRPEANEELIAALFPSHETAKRERGKNAIFFAVCSALFTLISVVGLFLGFDTATSELIAGRKTLMNGSLFGLMFELVRGSLVLPAAEGAAGFFSVLLYGMVCVLIAAIAASLVLTICAVVFPRAAEKLTYANAFLTLFAYGSLFALTYAALGFRTGALTAELFDAPTALTSSAIVLLLTVMAAVRKRKFAAANFFLFFLSVLSLFALYFPNTALLSDIVGLLAGESALPLGVKISLAALIALTAANAAAGVVRLCASKRYFIDVIRFGLQALAVFSLIASSFIADAQSGVFTDQPMALTLLAASTFAAFLFSAFMAALLASGRKRN